MPLELLADERKLSPAANQDDRCAGEHGDEGEDESARALARDESDMGEVGEQRSEHDAHGDPGSDRCVARHDQSCRDDLNDAGSDSDYFRQVGRGEYLYDYYEHRRIVK